MIKELEELARYLKKSGPYSDFIEVNELSQVSYKGKDYPLHSFILGCKNPEAPTYFLTGGVHGLERIGAQLCFSYLKHLIDRILWDQVFLNMLKDIRFVFIPLLNPVGYEHYTRSNANGVDLMRNSPIDAVDKVPWLVGGHRVSNKLPWYRGTPGQLEPENKFLEDVFTKYCLKSKCLIAVDFHSGFGLKDQLWFPYAHTKDIFPHLPHVHSLLALFEKTYPYHVYKIEPQNQVYMLHGDLWDYLYLKYKKENNGVFIPLTLEMGSWSWVKKNPIQLISKDGLFNPIKGHREKRTYRRHHLLLDFISHALISNHVWADLDPQQQLKHGNLAKAKWYEV